MLRNKIKVMPSKVLNEALDKWILISMGEILDLINYGDCSYCAHFSVYPTSFTDCDLCPLKEADFSCCELWEQFTIEMFNRYGYDWDSIFRHSCHPTLEARKIADKMVDYIIQRCVYLVDDNGEVGVC